MTKKYPFSKRDTVFCEAFYLRHLGHFAAFGGFKIPWPMLAFKLNSVDPILWLFFQIFPKLEPRAFANSKVELPRLQLMVPPEVHLPSKTRALG